MNKIISESILPIIDFFKEHLSSSLKISFIIILLLLIPIISADAIKAITYSISFLLGVILGEALTR